MNKRVYTVTQISRYIKNLFAGDGFLSAVSVSGEVSNCKYHSSGHIYFSLKDAGGAINCVMFAGNRKGLAFRMKDGDKVVVSGNVDVYERSGCYQLYAVKIDLMGMGGLYEQYLLLKKKLEAEGIFDPAHKKPIPKYAQRVGVVTASTGAAVRDIQTIAARRNRYVQMILFPVQVQGRGAKESIAAGIRALDMIGVDIIIVGRGGGSIEDLWAFNEEEVARAIFECETPVISAVGHETDTTIADYAADRRAPTPSAAAEIAVFDLGVFRKQLAWYSTRLTRAEAARCSAVRGRASRYRSRLASLSPAVKIVGERHRERNLELAFSETMQKKLDARKLKAVNMSSRFRMGLRQRVREKETGLELVIERFKGKNPLDRLRQGYSYVDDGSRKAVRSIKGLQSGDRLRIHVTDGLIISEVKEVSEYGK